MAEKEKKTRKYEYDRTKPRYSKSRVPKKCTFRQLRAIDHFFANGGNKKLAMLSAGYSESTARYNSGAWYDKPRVQQEINRRQKALSKKHDLNADWVIQRMMRLATAGEVLAPYKRIDREGMLFWDFTGASEEELALVSELSVDIITEGEGEDRSIVKKFKIKYPDAMQALMALARHLGLLNDKLELSGSLSERIQAGRARLFDDNKDDDAKETVH